MYAKLFYELFFHQAVRPKLCMNFSSPYPIRSLVRTTCSTNLILLHLTSEEVVHIWARLGNMG